MLGHIDRLLSNLGPPWIFGLALIGVSATGLADYLSGFELSLSVFYLAPVAVSAWYAGRYAGLGIALLSAATWLAADIGAGSAYSHPAIAVWNATMHLTVFVLTSALLSALRLRLLAESARARTDPLTGVLNARAFAEQLGYSLALAQREGTPLTLAYVDLDDFKQINDRYGHTQGDRVLVAVGQTLQEATRRTDIAARLGGDEFVLILPDTDRIGAESLIRKFSQKLRIALDATGSGVTCSIGAVTFASPPLSVTQAIDAADRLMYRVKKRGKNAMAFELAAGQESPLSPSGR